SRSKIVDRDGDAHVLQAPQRGVGRLPMGHERAFGDLDLEKGWIDVVRLERTGDPPHEALFADLSRRNIDGDANIAERGTLPGAHLLAHRFDDPGSHRYDHAHVFQRGNEIARHDYAM